MSKTELDIPPTEVLVASAALITPRTTFGPYETEWWEIVWMATGRAKVTSGTRSWELAPGDVHLSPPRSTNLWEWDGEQVIREGLVQFRLDGTADWPRNRVFAPDSIVPALLQHMIWLSRARPDGWRQARNEALRYALRAYIGNFVESDPFGGGSLPEPIERVVAYVQRIWYQPPLVAPRLDDLAAAANLTTSHLCKIFERHLDVSPVEAFRVLRIQRATVMLAQTSLSLATVAYQAGFANQFHFSRAFRAITALTPSEFRARPNARFELSRGMSLLANSVWRDPDLWEVPDTEAPELIPRHKSAWA